MKKRVTQGPTNPLTGPATQILVNPARKTPGPKTQARKTPVQIWLGRHDPKTQAQKIQGLKTQVAMIQAHRQ